MICFENEGLVPMEAFSSFGLSAKPGSKNPIGKFGTGLKYAVAVVLRLGGRIALWRDGVEYEFYTREQDFRGTAFQAVLMRRRRGISKWFHTKLPFNTHLGEHWKPWMAVRELEANCRDEGGHSYERDVVWGSHLSGTEGKTIILVDCPEFEESYSRLDEIFLPEKELLFETDTCRVFSGSSSTLFYRGMRVSDLRKPSMFTYELKSVFLTEDRTSMYSFLDKETIRDALLSCTDAEIVDRVSRCEDNCFEASLDWDKKSLTPSPSWGAALRRSGLSPRFSTMRDVYHYGIDTGEQVEMRLTVSEWLSLIHDRDDVLAERIKKGLHDAGWRGQA